MRVDLTPEADLLRVDRAGFDALLAAQRSPDAAAPEVLSVLTAIAGGPLDRALAVAAAPVASFVLTVAGPDIRLVHRAWLASSPEASGCALLLGVHEELFQLVPQDPAFLPAAIVRLARLHPRRRTGTATAVAAEDDTVGSLLDPDPAVRRPALDRLGAGYAWRLTCDDAPDLTVVDGRAGVLVHVPADGALVPTTNTAIYRLLSTLVPPPGQA
jgi:hypothetical protein